MFDRHPVKIYNFDNIDYTSSRAIEDGPFDIIYADPPYNTGNQFNYSDKEDCGVWENRLDTLISNIQTNKLLAPNGVFLFSISEESLRVSLNVIYKHFKYVYPPFIWQTKSVFNANKTNTVNSVVTEFIIAASNEKITTNPEKVQGEQLEQKIANYRLRFLFKRHPHFILGQNAKQYVYFKPDEYEILDHQAFQQITSRPDVAKVHEEVEERLKGYGIAIDGQYFQQRTAQQGHGSMRYVKELTMLDRYDENNLYLLLNVKDKQGLGGKFLKGNKYFQSLNTNNVVTKIPTFLGNYQPGITGFQTAKPISLMTRLFEAFRDKQSDNNKLLDLYCGSGNTSIAAHKLGFQVFACEVDKDVTKRLSSKNFEKHKVEYKWVVLKNSEVVRIVLQSQNLTANL